MRVRFEKIVSQRMLNFVCGTLGCTEVDGNKYFNFSVLSQTIYCTFTMKETENKGKDHENEEKARMQTPLYFVSIKSNKIQNKRQIKINSSVRCLLAGYTKQLASKKFIIVTL